MTTGEKFEKVADAVYKKGASDFGTPFDVTGTSLVTIDKVHPKEHDVEVLTDAESVTACGKNLFDISKDTLSKAYHVGLTMTVNDDGSFNLDGTLTRNYAYVKPDGNSIWGGYTIPKGTTVVLSSNFESDVATDCIGIVVRREIGNNGAIEIQGNSMTNGKTIKHTLANEGKTVGYCFRFPDRAVGDEVHIRNIKLQCEIGSVATEWEAYKGGTYPAEDGKAIVKSVSPTMNITTPTSGANIEAKGYLDGQAVIDELSQAIVDLGGEI